jgi:hypothetical protein
MAVKEIRDKWDTMRMLVKCLPGWWELPESCRVDFGKALTSDLDIFSENGLQVMWRWHEKVVVPRMARRAKELAAVKPRRGHSRQGQCYAY